MTTHANVWSTYVATMNAARDAATSFADTLERYLRKGVHSHGFRHFDDACRAADRYSAAVRKASGYHDAVIPRWFSGHIINSSEQELLEVMRELRGTAVYHRQTAADGRCTMQPRYAADGIVGFFISEVQSMQPFGSPRRLPTQEGTD